MGIRRLVCPLMAILLAVCCLSAMRSACAGGRVLAGQGDDVQHPLRHVDRRQGPLEQSARDGGGGDPAFPGRLRGPARSLAQPTRRPAQDAPRVPLARAVARGRSRPGRGHAHLLPPCALAARRPRARHLLALRYAAAGRLEDLGQLLPADRHLGPVRRREDRPGPVRLQHAPRSPLRALAATRSPQCSRSRSPAGSGRSRCC